MLALMEASDLEEIEWDEADRYLKVGAMRIAQPTSAAPPPAALRPAQRLASPTPHNAQKAITAGAPPTAPVIAADEIALVSPMVGVFYRAGKPGDPPLVEVGQTVRRDQPIGIIEAMKIFSEIPAEHGGLIVAIPVQDGQLVHAGTPLVILRRDG